MCKQTVPSSLVRNVDVSGYGCAQLWYRYVQHRTDLKSSLLEEHQV